MVQTPNGTIVAFAEARHGSCGDGAVQGIAVRRSFDGGHTWGPVATAVGNASYYVGNPSVMYVSQCLCVLARFETHWYSHISVYDSGVHAIVMNLKCVCN